MATADEFLKTVRRLGFEIIQNEQEIQELKELAVNITQKITGMPHNSNPSSSLVANAACRIVDLQKENKQKRSLVDDALSIVQKIPDRISRVVLIKRYFNLKSWETIADEMDYSIPHIYRFHKDAKRNLDQVLSMIVNDS